MGRNEPKLKLVELPDVLTFVFSWQGYQLCIRTKYRGTEQAVYENVLHDSKFLLR